MVGNTFIISYSTMIPIMTGFRGHYEGINRHAYLQWLQNIEGFIKDFTDNLQGIYRTSSDEYKRIGRPIMNEEGASKTRTYLLGRLNRVTVVSSIDERDKRRIARSIAEKMLDVYIREYKRFEMDKSDINPTVLMVYDFAYLVLSRAVNDGERGASFGYAVSEQTEGSIISKRSVRQTVPVNAAHDDMPPQ